MSHLTWSSDQPWTEGRRFPLRLGLAPATSVNVHIQIHLSEPQFTHLGKKIITPDLSTVRGSFQSQLKKCESWINTKEKEDDKGDIISHVNDLPS